MLHPEHVKGIPVWPWLGHPLEPAESAVR